MNIKKIKELVEIMKENDLTEVEVEQEGVKVHLVKGGRTVAVEQQVVSVPQVQSAAPQAAAASEAPQAKPAQGGKEVKAPMVGTFYRSSSPDVDPYVQVGDTVKKGDVLCIVEAMKMMNEVKSEFSGKIWDILVENAEPVEFGQVMFLIEA